jgi:rare lipoprotein A
MGFPSHVLPTCHRRPAAMREASFPALARLRASTLRVATGCVVIGLSAMTMGCAQSAETVAQAAPEAPASAERTIGDPQVGTASYYARHFTGRRTASGARFDPASDTIAHRTLPFGTVVRVTNLRNGLTTTGTVQDRGPWTRGRIVDLSPRIARHLDMMRSGVAQVEIVPVELAEAPE